MIVPAYNATRFLGPTLESLRKQTYRDFETIVIDDGSQDETAALAGRYAEVHVLRQANAGVAAARNRGARETRSEWLAFLDADDLWMPEKLSLQLNLAEESGAGAIFCDLTTIDADGRELPQVPGPSVSLEMEPLLLHSDAIPQGTSSTLLVRRSIFESTGGYDESLATMADWDLLIRLRLATAFAHIPRRLVAYRRYPGTMSRSVSMLERESLLVLEKIFGRSDLPAEWRRLEPRSRAWNDLVLSGSYFGVGRIGAAVRFGLRAVTRDPSLLARLLSTPARRARRIGKAAL